MVQIMHPRKKPVDGVQKAIGSLEYYHNLSVIYETPLYITESLLFQAVKIFLH